MVGSRSALFPRARARGPIEAHPITRGTELCVSFPRARARGPIEAAQSARAWRPCQYFHERALVAPLKPWMHGKHQAGSRHFHERALVAPWKRIDVAVTGPVTLYFDEASTSPCVFVSGARYFHERALVAQLNQKFTVHPPGDPFPRQILLNVGEGAKRGGRGQSKTRGCFFIFIRL